MTGPAIWLMEHAGPAIRYRTATELLDGEGIDLEAQRAGLLTYEMTQDWIDRLIPVRPGDMFSLHGSQREAFENVCAKLCELGIRPGMLPVVDASVHGYRQYLAEVDVFTCRPLLASCLNWAGYGDDEAVQACLIKRLDRTYELAKSGDYDIYIDHDTFGDCPAAFRKRPLVDPEFYDGLPGLWDMYAFAHFPEALLDEGTRDRIETVAAYVLHPDYQALDEGYGYMRAGPRRYYSIGWSVHLPAYEALDFTRAFYAYTFVQRLELMAHFATARASEWFRRSVAHLESFHTDRGTYRFPARYLREQRNGYWVQGAYMRLEVNRRSRQSLEIESTFRMCQIKRLMAEGG